MKSRLKVRAWIAIWILILCGTVAGPAFSWSKAGHRAMAVVAYRDVMSHAPGVVDAIAKLMEAHPAAARFAGHMREEGADPVARRERLFAEMAQWPDEVRSGLWHGYHRGSWHTIDIPYVAPGARLAAKPVEGPRENVLWAFRENLRIFLDRSSTREQQAVALCWIFHLTGDVHQPLHTAALFNDIFPEGDRHGGRFWVRTRATAAPISLHYYWDGLVLRSLKNADVLAAAARLAASYPSSAAFTEIQQRPFKDADTFETWAREESYALAVTEAYDAGRLPGSAAKDNAPVLSAAYMRNAESVGARRMALSGYRLAEILKLIVARAVAQ